MSPSNPNEYEIMLQETTDDKNKQSITDNMISSTYLQKLLMEFFIQDNETKEKLIPILLNFIGCSKLQIQQAQKSWANSKGSKIFRFF